METLTGGQGQRGRACRFIGRLHESRGTTLVADGGAEGKRSTKAGAQGTVAFVNASLVHVGERDRCFRVLLCVSGTAAAVMLFALPGSLVAQTGRQITRDGFDSGAAGIRIDPGDSGKVQQFIQVTPVRTWRHVDGRTIEAALLGSRPEGKTEGRVELVALKGDKPAIRLLKGGKVYTFALEKLSEEDREHISKLDAAQGEREKEAVKGGNGQADLIS